MGRVFPAIRIGLRQVAGLSEAERQSILRAREEGGPFRSLEEFCRRTAVARDGLRNLILCGALDSIHPHRRQLLWELEAALAARDRPADAGLQLALEDLAVADPGRPSTGDQAASQAVARTLPHPTLADRVRWEVEILGLCAHTHPMTLFRADLDGWETTPAAQVPHLPDGMRVRVAGIVLCRMRPPTRSGATVVFITLEDDTGLADVVLFPKVYEEYGEAAFSCDLLVVDARVQRQGPRGVALIVERVYNPLRERQAVDARTGQARKEMSLPGPVSDFAPRPIQWDYDSADDDL